MTALVAAYLHIAYPAPLLLTTLGTGLYGLLLQIKAVTMPNLHTYT
jgi:hypothetical protein